MSAPSRLLQLLRGSSAVSVRATLSSGAVEAPLESQGTFLQLLSSRPELQEMVYAELPHLDERPLKCEVSELPPAPTDAVQIASLLSVATPSADAQWRGVSSRLAARATSDREFVLVAHPDRQTGDYGIALPRSLGVQQRRIDVHTSRPSQKSQVDSDDSDDEDASTASSTASSSSSSSSSSSGGNGGGGCTVQ